MSRESQTLYCNVFTDDIMAWRVSNAEFTDDIMAWRVSYAVFTDHIMACVCVPVLFDFTLHYQ